MAQGGQDDINAPGAGDVPEAGVILVAFEKLFGGGRGVHNPKGPARASLGRAVSSGAALAGGPT